MTIYRPMACGFHEHGDLGSLDGASTTDQKVRRAKELGRVADCLTDHGTMNGLASQWKYCEKHGLQCIHGIEAYVQDPFNPTYLDGRGRTQKAYAHLTIHFKDQLAYRYFCSLTPKMEERAVIKYGERKPILLLEELEPIAGHIVLGSGCLVGCCMKYLKNGEVDKTVAMYERLRTLAGPGNFFVEVFPHKVTHEWQRPTKTEEGLIIPGRFVEHECAADGMPLDYQKKPNQMLLELAKKYNDPVIISEDSHFAKAEDKIVQDSKLSNGDESWRFYNSLHMLSSDEAAASLKDQLGVSDRDIEEYIDNSYKFVDLFKGYKFETSKDKIYLPRMEDVYEVKGQQTTKDKLKELIRKHGKMPSPTDPRYSVYAERLAHEVSVLADNGKFDFLPYFFILEDLCDFCTREGMLYNARGSAGGSLILFLLGGSITDPIRYGLSFARFMTLGRIKSGSLPDIDMDFSDQHRVFAYLQQKYGDRFVRISIQKPLKVKSSIKDIERNHFGKVRIETEIMCKNMPVIPQGVTDSQWLFGFTDDSTGEHVPGFIELEAKESAALRQYRDDNPEIWATVLKCLGVQREKSVHACGTLIASEPVQNFMPVIKIGDTLCTAFGPKEVEFIGGIKFDILGVKYLRALEIVMKLINDTRPESQKLTWEEFPYDERTFSEIYGKMKLKGLFQVNTNSMAPFVKKLQPSTVNDLSNLVALVRPGALDAASPVPGDTKHKSAAEYFAACARGQAQPYYIHPSLEPILNTTYGVMLMQEQQITAAKMILDLDDEKAEAFRRATGKKDKTASIENSKKIIDGCLAKGWTQEQAAQMANVYMAASRYSFNASHSMSYGLVSHNGAWLKVTHPLQFWMGLLTAYGDDRDDIKDLLEECGDIVLPIDAIESNVNDWKIVGRHLRPPMIALKDVGQSAAAGLREFLDTPLESLVRKPVKEKKPSTRKKKAEPTDLAFGD